VPLRPVTAKGRVLQPEFVRSYLDSEIREKNRLKALEAKLPGNRQLTRKQRRFVAELLADPGRNAVQAAIRAGYSENTAYTSSSEILAYPHVKAAVEEEDKKIFRRLEITHDKVLQEVATIAFSNMGDYLTDKGDGKFEIDLNKISVQQASVIQDYSVDEVGTTRRVRIRLADKLSALGLLGKHLKLFVDNATELKPQLTINFLDKIVAGEITVEQLNQEMR